MRKYKFSALGSTGLSEFKDGGTIRSANPRHYASPVKVFTDGEKRALEAKIRGDDMGSRKALCGWTNGFQSQRIPRLKYDDIQSLQQTTLAEKVRQSIPMSHPLRDQIDDYTVAQLEAILRKLGWRMDDDGEWVWQMTAKAG